MQQLFPFSFVWLLLLEWQEGCFILRTRRDEHRTRKKRELGTGGFETMRINVYSYTALFGMGVFILGLSFGSWPLAFFIAFIGASSLILSSKPEINNEKFARMDSK